MAGKKKEIEFSDDEVASEFKKPETLVPSLEATKAVFALTPPQGVPVLSAMLKGSRVKLRTTNPFANVFLGTVVDVGREGAVVNWDGGPPLSYVTFDAIEVVE